MTPTQEVEITLEEGEMLAEEIRREYPEHARREEWFVKNVVRLRQVMSVEEIVEKTGVPRSTVYYWLKKAKEKGTKDHRCYTPSEVLESVRDFCRAIGITSGQIPVDPASDATANNGIEGRYAGVQAARFIDATQDGRIKPWTADDESVVPAELAYVNPPYSHVDGNGGKKKGLCKDFIEAAERNLAGGSCKSVIMLLPLRMTHEWSDRIMTGQWSVIFVGESLRFVKPDGTRMTPGVGSTPMEHMIVYRGPHADLFASIFARWGYVFRR